MGDYVLIVDDDPDVLLLVQDVLDTLGLEGREALDGQRALDVMAESLPRAIVLDLRMPNMDGYAMLDRLRETAAGREVPIIVLSVLATDNDMAVREIPGVVGVLGKGDFSPDKLRAMLSKALQE